MNKIELDPKTFIYPMPATLVGANVNDKANFLTIGYCGAVNHNPPTIAIGVNKKHYTNFGIQQNKTYSVNIPSAEMVDVVDYCGLVSGHKVDKSELFQTFYGCLKSAPMIAECPLNLECQVIQMLELEMQYVYIGKVIKAYSQKRFITENLPDIKKMNIMAFSMHDNNYWTIGKHVGRAWSIGKKFKRNQS